MIDQAPGKPHWLQILVDRFVASSGADSVFGKRSPSVGLKGLQRQFAGSGFGGWSPLEADDLLQIMLLWYTLKRRKAVFWLV